MIVPVNHVEPVPRRIRAYLGAEKVLDTTRALYVWEWPYYPQYYVPLADVRQDRLIAEGHAQQTGRGKAELHGLRASEVHRPRAARLITDSAIEGLKAPSASSGPRSTPGSRRTSRSSCTRATRTRGSTRCARTAGCGSSSTGSYWPTRPRR